MFMAVCNCFVSGNERMESMTILRQGCRHIFFTSYLSQHLIQTLKIKLQQTYRPNKLFNRDTLELRKQI